jgi:hypothetical protein
MQTEASTAAWQAYLLWNGVLALIAIVPALLVADRLWRRMRAGKPASESETVESPASLSRSSAN